LSLSAVNSTLALLCAVFALEMFAATQSAAARSVTITINPAEPQDTPDVVLANAIEHAEAVLPYRPDDPELHRSIALWWISRYRLAIARELRTAADPSWEPRGRGLWRATSLNALCARVASLTQAEDHQQADAIRNLWLVQDYLVPARKHLLEAAQYGPLTRDVSQNLARLAFLAESSGGDAWRSELARYARQSLFVTPSAPDTLFATGVVLDAAGLQSLADCAFSRCLKMADEHLVSIWQVISAKRPLTDLLENIIPRQVGVLVSLAEHVPDARSKQLLSMRAEQLLQQGTWEDARDPSPQLRARLAELGGQTDRAITLYRSALSNDPWNEEDIETRLRIAQLLKQAGRLSEAESELSLLRHLAPERSDIQKQFEALRLRDLGLPRETSSDSPRQIR
jgi:tetratricopeptide (TPR) repeat protein